MVSIINQTLVFFNRAATNNRFKAQDVHALTNEYPNICLYILYQLQAYKLIQEAQLHVVQDY